MGGNDRFFDRVTAPSVFMSWVGTFICGVILLKPNKVVGWGLLASAIAAFVFAVLTREL